MLQLLQSKLKEIKNSLYHVTLDLETYKSTVTDVHTKLSNVQQELQNADNTVIELRTLYYLLEEYHELAGDNLQFKNTKRDLEKELAEHEQTTQIDNNFTIHGTKYLNSVREFYYSLLTVGVAPEKIESIIRTVLSKLCPTLDIKNLKLPKKSCANYMRMAEMPTVSDGHKSSCQADAKLGHMNTDGTTLNLRKLIGSSVSRIVMGVQEVADGTSETMIQEIDRQLTRLRQIANDLDLPNADSINWTLIVSSTSDGAATQTKFNKLIKDLRARDDKTFGPADASLKEVITNKCGMHLGVNLRKDQNAGIHEYEREGITPVDNELDSMEENEQLTTNQRREYIPTDNFVHAFCKLLGQHGTPEYGQGNSFWD